MIPLSDFIQEYDYAPIHEILMNKSNYKYHELETLTISMIRPFLLKWLITNRDYGYLKQVDDKNHTISMIRVWNKFIEEPFLPVDSSVQEDLLTLLKPISLQILLSSSLDDYLLKTEHLPWYTFGLENEYFCQRTGIPIHFEFEHGQLKVGTSELDKKDLIELTPLEPVSIKELTINFPSGELLICDWIRLPEFQSFSKYLKLGDLNNEVIRDEITKNFAKHNILHLILSSKDPVIMGKDNILIFGYPEGLQNDGITMPPYEEYGVINTQLWGVTVIDKKTLLDILEITMSKNKASHYLNRFLLNNQDEINLVKIEKGDYFIYYNSNFEDMQQLSSFKEIKDLRENAIISSIISKNQLTYDININNDLYFS